ncbi:MAG: DciA family protein [Candidatus Omnitrophota bacterium]
MDGIKEVINSVIGKLSDSRKKDFKKELEGGLKKILEKEDLRHVKVTTFFHGILCINVDSPARAYKLNLKKERLTEYLNNNFGEGNLKDIRFRIGKIK